MSADGTGRGGAGRLIALEGIDGCGKSTQARLLAEALGAVLTFEPGATALGREVRRLVLDPGGQPPDPRAESLLLLADRAQHIAEVVRPALRTGQWVVTDRFTGSTLAYQGWGGGLAIGPLMGLAAWATDGMTPDLTVLVDLDVPRARLRLEGSQPDRMERRDGAFHQRVREGFLAQAASDDSWVVVDGTADVEGVSAAISRAVHLRLGAR